MMTKDIYIVTSQTGTKFSRLLHVFNRAPYNHASISLDRQMPVLYSFGRQCLWLPIASGFVREVPGRGIYRRYQDTRCAVYRVPVSAEQYARLREAIRRFEEEEWAYRYNFVGLIAMMAGIPIRLRHHFVCSQFVAYVLKESGIWDLAKDISLARPQDFAELAGAELVYQGRLNEYHPGAREGEALALPLATARPARLYRLRRLSRVG